MNSLGFTSEKKGLFADYKVAGLRPDYFKKVGDSGILFEVEREGVDEFEERKMEYLTSEFHRFDSCLMSLKKIEEYIPDSNI